MAPTHVGQWAMENWAMARAATLMGWAMATTLMEQWAMVRATTLLMGWAMTTTLTLMNMACTNLGPMGWEWAWAWDQAQPWAMLWALERHMRDMVAMEWALRVAPLTKNNTVGGGAWVVTAAAATAVTAVMTSAAAK